MDNEITTITRERLEHLLKLEASLPKMIEEAVQEYKKSSLRRLHEIDKQNPEAINARVKRYVEKHRESINARRREKRQKLKNINSKENIIVEKAVEEPPKIVLSPSPSPTILSHVTTIVTKPDIQKKPRVSKKAVVEPISYPPILKENVTVSFSA